VPVAQPNVGLAAERVHDTARCIFKIFMAYINNNKSKAEKEKQKTKKNENNSSQ